MVKGFRLIASLPLQIFRQFSFSLVRNTLRTPISSFLSPIFSLFVPLRPSSLFSLAPLARPQNYLWGCALA